MMYWGNHMGAGDLIFSVFGTLILIGLIVALVVWAVSPRGGRNSTATASGESAREILDRRLAGGELTIEQYQLLRETLGKAEPSPGGSRPRTPAGARG